MRVTSPAPETGNPELELARSLTLFVYVMHALASAFFVTFFVAIFVNYSRRASVAGTVYESHFDWQIRTFWFSLLYFTTGVILVIAAIVRFSGHQASGGGWLLALGVSLLFFNLCWHLYRVIRGLMHWSDRQPMRV